MLDPLVPYEMVEEHASGCKAEDVEEKVFVLKCGLEQGEKDAAIWHQSACTHTWCTMPTHLQQSRSLTLPSWEVILQTLKGEPCTLHVETVYVLVHVLFTS